MTCGTKLTVRCLVARLGDRLVDLKLTVPRNDRYTRPDVISTFDEEADRRISTLYELSKYLQNFY